jgi:hypothetical protein
LSSVAKYSSQYSSCENVVQGCSETGFGDEQKVDWVTVLAGGGGGGG